MARRWKVSLADEPLLLGDIILVVGNWKLIGMLAKQGRDFVALNLPEEVSEASPAHSQAPHAIFCLVLMVALMLTDEIPNPVAAIIACLLMGKFRCIDAESAYKSIHWPSINFDRWDDAVCCGITENGRCRAGGERADGHWRRLRATY